MSPAPGVRLLSELLAGFAAAPAVPVAELDLDSRRIVPGALFLACRGRHGHGLAHLEQALARGAAAVAYQPATGVPPPRLRVPAVAVPELASHAGAIAARFFGEPSRHLWCVGITGTDGKTSTAHLLAQAFAALGRPAAYFGTLGYGRLERLSPAPTTTPDPVDLQRRLAQQLAAGAEICAIEVSSHALDQDRVTAVAFDCAVLTNVGRDHLDYHGSEQAYAEAKRKLFELAPTAVLNLDDALGAAWAKTLRGARRVVGFSLDGGGRLEPPYLIGEQLTLDADGLKLRLRAEGGEHAEIDSPLLGRFNAYNLLAAAAVLREAGVALADAARALSAARTVPGRAEGFRVAGRPLTVVDYAHTPQALEQILLALRAHCRGQLWCVFGCGGDRDRGKRPLMGAVAAARADRVILTDDNPRSEDPRAIVAEILDGTRDAAAGTRGSGLGAREKIRVIHDRAQAIRTAVMQAAADDVVLVAGKGHEDYQIYGSQRRHFSDREQVAELLGTGDGAEADHG